MYSRLALSSPMTSAKVLTILPRGLVFFYVHLALLSRRSNNNFGGLLPPAPPVTGDAEQGVAQASIPPIAIPVDESDSILNLVLHFAYRMCGQITCVRRST